MVLWEGVQLGRFSRNQGRSCGKEWRERDCSQVQATGAPRMSSSHQQPSSVSITDSLSLPSPLHSLMDAGPQGHQTSWTVAIYLVIQLHTDKWLMDQIRVSDHLPYVAVIAKDYCKYIACPGFNLLMQPELKDIIVFQVKVITNH